MFKSFRQKLIAGILAILSAFGIYSYAQSKSFIWDSNKEPDIKDYLLVTCPTSPCTLTTVGAVQTVVVHVAGQATQASPVPSAFAGFAVVYARDTSGNVSAPSNQISVDTLAPASPGNLRIG